MKTMPAAFVRAILAALLAAFAGLAWGQGAPKDAAGPNDTCLMCHGDAGAKAASGKSVAVDAKQFAASVHGGMSLPCTACHADSAVGQMPHGTVKPAQCASCHEQAVKDYAATAHGQARKDGNNVAARCGDCHGTHDIVKRDNPASRVHRANLEKTCAACHGNEALIQKANLPGGNVASKFHDSIHGQAMAAKTSAQGAVPTCTSCHGTHDLRAKTDPQSRVAKANVPDTCGSCHMGVKAEWSQSEHGKLRQASVMQAPGCTDCHSTHEIARHSDPKFELGVIDRCATCHADFARSYRDTFHGQVTRLGFTQIATCASCHGAHSVLPKENPLSKVSAANRVATCQQCHPKANANFASYDPHADRHSMASGQVLFFTGKFMDVLLLGVFAVFGLHTVLWFVRSLKAMRERGTPRKP
jgi:hypothetical protein